MTVIHGESVVTWLETDPLAQRGTLVVLPGRAESLATYDDLGREVAGLGHRVHVLLGPDLNATRAAVQATELLAEANQDLPRVLLGSADGAEFALGLGRHADVAGITHLVLAGTSAGGGLSIPVLELPGTGSAVTAPLVDYLRGLGSPVDSTLST